MTAPRPAGRPPIGPPRSIRLTPEEWARLDREAARLGITRTAAARRIITDWWAALDEAARTQSD